MEYIEGESELDKKMKYLTAYISFSHCRAITDVHCIIVKLNRFQKLYRLPSTKSKKPQTSMPS